MMSMSNVSGVSAGMEYYEVDDYYTADNAKEHTELSQWHGKGAKLQGLSGPVLAEDFRKMLQGKAPDGTLLGKRTSEGVQHRPGLDLTFSPPKSVAIMAQVFGDKELVKIHNQAVDMTLDLIERFAAQARVSKDGITGCEPTGNLTVAKFFHTSTRAQDPGMHTHAVIANMTLCDDGRWRSLHADKIWENSKARFGEYYSMSMAYLAHQRGYEISSKGRNAEYELSGVKQNVIDYFSTRSQQIKGLLAERGLSGPINREWAALVTRDKKAVLEKGMETSLWQERATAQGFDLHWLRKAADEKRLTLDVGDKSAYVIESLKDSITHLNTRSSTFTMQNLVQYTRNLVIGKVQDKDIMEGIQTLQNEQYLLQPNESIDVYMSRETAAIESDNLLRTDFGKNLYSQIARPSAINRLAEHHKLNDGQHGALRFAGESKDRVNAVQGWAGVGKTTFARALNDMLTQNGFRVMGLSPSATAATELEQGSGIKSTTLASFAFRYEYLLHQPKGTPPPQYKEKPYIVVDESSFVSAKDFNQVLQIAERMDARILTIGDYKQLGSVDAGAPHEQGLDHGIAQSELTDIVRQNNAPVLRSAIYHAIENRASEAMSRLNVVEPESCIALYDKADQDKLDGKEWQIDYGAMRKALATEAASAYLALSPIERAKTALVVQTNEIRTMTNDLIRSELVARGEVDSVSIDTTALKNKGLTHTQTRYAHNYDVGNIVRFNRPSEHFGVEKDSYFYVVDNDTAIGKDRYITLESASNPEHQFSIHPKEIHSRGERNIEIFEPSERQVAAGDVLRWNRNDKSNDIINSQSATVVSVNPETQHAEVLLANDQVVTMDMKDLSRSHFDYHFSNTVHSVQGATVDNTITVVESWHKLLTTMKSFYVGISRARTDVTVITDSEDKAIKTLESNIEPSDIALNHFDRAEQPVAFDLVRDVQEQLGQGADLKEVYLDLISHLDGDRFAAQQILHELAVDVGKLDQTLVMEEHIRSFEGTEFGLGSELESPNQDNEGLSRDDAQQDAQTEHEAGDDGMVDATHEPGVDPDIQTMIEMDL